MQNRTLKAFVFTVISLGAVALAFQDWAGLAAFPAEVMIGYGVLIILGLISEGTALRLTLGRGGTTSSTIFLPLIACVLLFGPAATVLFFAISGVISEFFIRRKEVVKASFNLAQYVISAAIAGWAFQAVGGVPLAIVAATAPGTEFSPQLLPFAVFGFVCLGVNNLLVIGAITLSTAAPRRTAFSELLAKHSASFLHDVLISPLGILFAFLYFELGELGLAVSLLPLLFVRHSYLSKHLLEAANRDLLKALVKAIETRDPYTSGHSMRVQALAERIGRAMALNPRELEDLRTAALLHDIGKIEVVYEDILLKPGSLSVHEREIIQSHVTRGVEILSSLASVRSSVIQGVRHHHEAFDGSGYPDGLAGEEIPLFGRIIQVCDAVDAMLSDRPYRRRLSIDAVEEQLRRFTDVQFDGQIVSVVLAQGLIRIHAAGMLSTSTANEGDPRRITGKSTASPSHRPVRGRRQSEAVQAPTGTD
jgi:putative nucleotidyltransferase with HDIG domain